MDGFPSGYALIVNDYYDDMHSYGVYSSENNLLSDSVFSNISFKYPNDEGKSDVFDRLDYIDSYIDGEIENTKTILVSIGYDVVREEYEDYDEVADDEE